MLRQILLIQIIPILHTVNIDIIAGGTPLQVTERLELGQKGTHMYTIKGNTFSKLLQGIRQ